MSGNKILLRALPNVEFVHGYPGIPAGPERPQATIKGAIEVRLGNQAVKAKWVKIELRKVETIPSGSHGEDFIDFVGQSPITVWQAKDEDDTLSSKDFPFTIRVPETIPPSVALERGAGIKYEVVATLCTKGKKGLLRREASTTVSHTVPVVIDKHELHSTWPIYAQAEARHVVSEELTLAVDRTHTCFAPADRLSVMATLRSDKLSPVVLRGFEFSLRETIIYRAGPHSHGKKSAPQVHTSILGEQKVPVSATLYGGTLHKAELGCVVPGNHTTSSVNTGRHIDIRYTLNIKALLDKAKPITMDLPVTITNWPRHVSADMIRRIGTAPNLSLVPAGRPGMPSTPRTSEFRASQIFGPPRPPPVGSLPNVPNGVTHQSVPVPQGALVIDPPGSSTHAINTMAAYPSSAKHTPYNVPGQVSQRPPSSVAQLNPYTLPSHVSQTMPSSVRPGSIPNEKAGATSSKASTANPQEGPDEFGYNLPSNTVSATVPLRPSEKSDYGIIDATQRPASMANHRNSSAHSVTSDFGIGGANNRVSQYSQDGDVRNNVVSSPISSTGRRPRAMSRPLKIVNYDENILEEESPVKAGSSNPFGDVSEPQQPSGRSNSPPSTHSSIPPWPTAEEEKQRLFEKAKARAEKVHAMVKSTAAARSPSPTHSPPPTNGHTPSSSQQLSSPHERSGSVERPRTASPTPLKTTWPTSEDEKRRLWEQARAEVRRVQELAQTPPPQDGPSGRSIHQRNTSTHSSQDSHTNPALGPYTSSPPAMSAGAALYSHALASMSRPASSPAPNASSSSSLTPRRAASHSASSSNVTPATGPSATKFSTPQAPSASKHQTAQQEKDALRYFEAKKAVERRLREESDLPGSTPDNIPHEDPIAYDALFPPGNSNTAAPSTSTRLSEKGVLRRAYEARDAAATNQSPPPPHPPPPPPIPVASAHTPPPGRPITPPGQPEPLSEKEILRRAFEARDAAMIRSGQGPQPAILPTQAASAPAPPWMGDEESPTAELKALTPLSEKEQMRRAFEARDRALAAQQQAPPPPDYDMPPPEPSDFGPPPPSWNVLGGGIPLTAAEEKAQLQARYAQEEADSGPPVSLSPVTQPEEATYASPPADEKLNRSDSSESYLRRDPTIRAGKKRASQMITPPPPSTPPPPPPLLPRPPAEYIEETKLEDMRNSMVPSIELPADFSSSFDLAFGSFGQEKDAVQVSSQPS